MKHKQMSFDEIAEPDAADILAPYIGLVKAAFHDAWQKWNEFGDMLPHLQYVLSPRTRANFVNDHVCQGIKVQFSCVENVRVEDVNGLVLLTFVDPTSQADVLSVRFKKLNRELLSSNYPTAQQREFDAQRPFPGLPNVVRLTAGYQLDRLQQAIQDVWMTCSQNKNLLWAYAIDNEEGIGLGIDILEITIPKPVIGDVGVAPIVRPINVQKKDEEETK